MRIDISDEKDQANTLSEILWSMYQPKTVIDVGCNEGLYLEPFLGKSKVIGIDNDEYALAHAVVPVINLDLTLPQELPKYDLSICLEVLEHIPQGLSGDVLNNLCKTSDTIIFSAAQPGAGGVGHVNCQPKSYWINRFRTRGYEVCDTETAFIIQHLREKQNIMGWLLNNLMVLRKIGTESTFKAPSGLMGNDGPCL